MTTTTDARETNAPLVIASRPTEHVGMLRIDSPPRNAFGRAECKAFLAAFEAFQQDLNVRCLIVTGTGNSFLSGANLHHQKRLDPEDFENYADSDEGLGSIMRRIEAARFPVIAAINGYAIGGGLEVALCCDVRLASTDARFVCAGVNVGLILSWFRLPRIVGLGRAKEMLLSGAMYDARQADRWGLVTGLHEPEELMSAALTLAKQIATRAPLSVEATKQCANRAFDLPTEEAIAVQREQFLRLIGTRDHDEALQAFIEKRPASFGRR